MDLLAENQFALRRTRANAGFLKLHWNRDFEAKSKDNNVQGRDAISLFGIMATAGGCGCSVTGFAGTLRYTLSSSSSMGLTMRYTLQHGDYVLRMATLFYCASQKR